MPNPARSYGEPQLPGRDAMGTRVAADQQPLKTQQWISYALPSLIRCPDQSRADEWSSRPTCKLMLRMQSATHLAILMFAAMWGAIFGMFSHLTEGNAEDA